MIESLRAVLSVGSLLMAVVFFWAGTVGMLRFPDVYTRLHAMTKADNLGIGFVVFAVIMVAPSATIIFKLALTWGFILIAGTTAAHLVAESAHLEGVESIGGED